MRAFGLAYVRFAVAHPEQYRLATMEPCVAGAGEQSELDKMLDDSASSTWPRWCRTASPPASSPTTTRWATTFDLWAAAHGVAALMIAKSYLPWRDREVVADRVLVAAALGHAVVDRVGGVPASCDAGALLADWPLPGGAGSAGAAGCIAPRLLPRELHGTDRPVPHRAVDDRRPIPRAGRPPSERIVSDQFAPVFLGGLGRRLLVPLRGAGPVVRRAERLALTSIATSALCRHAFLDGQVLAALPEVEQVMILGAGFDSRAYRFWRALEGRPVFEVDLPPLSRHKREFVEARPETFTHGRASSVEVDFRTQSLAEQLAGSGFAVGAPTFVAWEGVSMYLTAEAVAETLRALAEVCGAGSVLGHGLWRTSAGAALRPGAARRGAGRPAGRRADRVRRRARPHRAVARGRGLPADRPGHRAGARPPARHRRPAL